MSKFIEEKDQMGIGEEFEHVLVDRKLINLPLEERATHSELPPMMDWSISIVIIMSKITLDKILIKVTVLVRKGSEAREHTVSHTLDLSVVREESNKYFEDPNGYKLKIEEEDQSTLRPMLYERRFSTMFSKMCISDPDFFKPSGSELGRMDMFNPQNKIFREYYENAKGSPLLDIKRLSPNWRATENNVIIASLTYYNIAYYTIPSRPVLIAPRSHYIYNGEAWEQGIIGMLVLLTAHDIVYSELMEPEAPLRKLRGEIPTWGRDGHVP